MVDQLENLGFEGQPSSKFLEVVFCLFSCHRDWSGSQNTHNLEPLPGRDRKKKEKRKIQGKPTLFQQRTRKRMALQDGAFMTITVPVQANTIKDTTLPRCPHAAESMGWSPITTLYSAPSGSPFPRYWCSGSGDSGEEPCPQCSPSTKQQTGSIPAPFQPESWETIMERREQKKETHL